MAFDEFGLPLAHEVFEGNVADTKTLGALLDRLTPADCAELKPVVVLDAGFASKANIKLLRDRHYSYLINITRNNRKKYAEFFEKRAVRGATREEACAQGRSQKDHRPGGRG